jgi:uncharacterized protein (DUF342 family)
MDQNPGENQPTAQNPASSQKQRFGTPPDGILALAFSESHMDVHADFIPPAVGGYPLTQDEVALALEKSDVTYGIRWQAIQDALITCNLDRLPVQDVIIACGDPPVDEITEYFERNPVLGREELRADKSGRIDHHSRSP